MENKKDWTASTAKGRLAQNFVRTILEFAGYNVMEYGIENHNQQIINEIKGFYNNDTNSRLMCMPDLVVVDPETKIAELVEIKYRGMKGYFNEYNTNFFFKWSQIKHYIDHWKDMTLIIALNVDPYCLCIRMKDVDWCKHYFRKIRRNGKLSNELWNFNGIYKSIIDIFPRVKQKHIEETLKNIPIAKKSE